MIAAGHGDEFALVPAANELVAQRDALLLWYRFVGIAMEREHGRHLCVELMNR